MFFLRFIVLCIISLTFVSCGGGGSKRNNSSVILSDRALLDCLPEDFNEELINLVTFECSNIDLSTAHITELRNLPKLKKIHLDHTNLINLNDISSIEQITDLKIVNNFTKINGGSKPLDISSITSLKKLQYLDLSYNYIPTLEAISTLENLKSLTLNKINIGLSEQGYTLQHAINLSPLSALTKLTSLSMEGNFVNGGIGNFSAFGDEESRQLFGFDFADLTALSNLTELKHLDLSSSIYGSINNSAGFPYFPKLISLDLSDNSNGRGANGSDSDLGLINISSLKKLTTLTRLDLHSNSINDISPIGSLTGLTFLDLSDNYYVNDIWRPNNNEKPIFGSIVNIEALITLSQLTFLNLSQTGINDFSFLAHLNSLSSLNLDNNYIRDDETNTFPFITTLEELSMKNNWLTNINFLSVYHLMKLDLSWNCISNFSPLQANELIKKSQQSISDCDVF